MKRDYEKLSKDLDYSSNGCISRVQLMRILTSIDQDELKRLTNKYFGKEFERTDELKWFAIDGKELRGSIDKSMGEKRGENVIFQIDHLTQTSQVLDFYSGNKESEKTVVKNYFENFSDLKKQAFTVDALHNSVNLLSIIEERKGIYVTQIKNNQKHLLNELTHIHKYLPTYSTIEDCEKGHGRIENRKAYFYPMNIEALPAKWKSTNVKCLICVEREVFHMKTNKHTIEKSYYISNLECSSKNTIGLFKAIRNHWKVEVNNYIRDVAFGEDQFLSLNSKLQRTVSMILNLTINGMRKVKKNEFFPEFRENCCFNREIAIKCVNFFS